MTDKPIDVEASHGWLHARLATEDHSSGMVEICAGVEFSIRLHDVSVYHAAETGVLTIGCGATGTFFQVIGTMKTMRGIMSRNTFKEA